MRTIILLGSSRANGNTHQLVSAFAPHINATVVNLNDYVIAPFDYEFRNQTDDFLSLIKEVLTYGRIILASPIYWYAPSATMKIFMDRLSDLLKLEKPLGRQLRTKKAALLATGSDLVPAECFEECFRLSYAYLGMDYQGMLYRNCENNFDLPRHQDAILAFARRLHAE